MQNDIQHTGVLGMRWGHRKGSSQTEISPHSGKTQLTAEQKTQRNKTIKKAAIGTATVVTVATAAAIYAKNKPAVDKFVKGYMESAKIKSTIKQGVKDYENAQYVKTHKDDILKSAGKIKKYKDHLSEDEVKNAIKGLQTVRDLRQLQQDNIKTGASYAQAFLTYGTVAVTAYNLKNSSLVKDTKKNKK